MCIIEPLDEGERGEQKSWLKTQHSENEYRGIWSHHFMGNRWGNSVRFYFGVQSPLTSPYLFSLSLDLF